MIARQDMDYSQKMRADSAEERPSLWMCGLKSLPRMKEKAQAEAEKILREFKQYYSGDITIEITVTDWNLCYSIGAILRVNGEICREYNDCELLFLELNELMLKRLMLAREAAG